LPYKNVLKFRTRQNTGGISICVFNTKIQNELQAVAHICRVRYSRSDNYGSRRVDYSMLTILVAPAP
jgi:hypothetical protein